MCQLLGMNANTPTDAMFSFTGLATLKPRFDLYAKANRVNRHPWLADLLIWRAQKSERLMRRMAGVLEETSNPGNLVSVRGIARLFLPRLL